MFVFVLLSMDERRGEQMKSNAVVIQMRISECESSREGVESESEGGCDEEGGRSTPLEWSGVGGPRVGKRKVGCGCAESV